MNSSLKHIVVDAFGIKYKHFSSFTLLLIYHAPLVCVFQFIQKLFGFLRYLDSVNHLYMDLDLCIVMTEQKTVFRMTHIYTIALKCVGLNVLAY